MRTLRQDIDVRIRNAWIGIVLLACSPRLARRKPGYDSPMRVLRRIAVATAIQFTIRHWLVPWGRAAGERYAGGARSTRHPGRGADRGRAARA